MPYGNRRYRRRYSRRSYGSERARWHIQQAEEFSDEVGHTDELVKRAFFSLSSEDLENLLDKYGRLYGDSARQYARVTIGKWRSHSVKMSGMVAQRLFALLPPYMSVTDTNKIIEAIWKRYGPRSKKYVYVGPDSDPEAVIAQIEEYLRGINILYPIPETLKRRFDWLAQNDAAAKERLLNHFMKEQRKAAIDSARLNLPMILATMNAEHATQMSRFSHSIFIGNHVVQINADPLRTGFILSNSGYDFTRPPFKWPKGSGVSLAASLVVVFGVIAYNVLLSGPTATSRSVARQAQQTESPLVPAPAPTAQVQKLALAPLATSSRPAGKPPKPLLTASRHIAATPLTTSTLDHSVARYGCSTAEIVSVSGDGSALTLSNGTSYRVADAVMRLEAGTWVTGDTVTVCTTPQRVSLTREYQTIDALATGSAEIAVRQCAALYIGYTTADGSEIGTTDGSVFQLISNPVSRLLASTWTTAELANVCTAEGDGTLYASVSIAYGRVETVVEATGTGLAREPACSEASISSNDGSGLLRIGRANYRIDNAVMALEARQLSSGAAVVLCRYSFQGTTHVSITSGYIRLQAVQTT